MDTTVDVFFSLGDKWIRRWTYMCRVCCEIIKFNFISNTYLGKILMITSENEL